MLRTYPDNLFTVFPQKLWKSIKSPMVTKLLAVISCALVLSSCTYFGWGKKEGEAARRSQGAGVASRGNPSPDSAFLDMSGDEVKKAFGEPDIVSRTPDNHVLWTYKPSWKLMPNNKGTIYVEFDNGKVIKIVRATR
ncbi:MAG: hypothetical protein A4E63_01068 [Syntrophorhabdus sp. PtaU1.Bin050]|nr:MAG: hypothetical protein A4E63_01068 [Syntrophorhabdus sp. PtaU1.Bin050]